MLVILLCIDSFKDFRGKGTSTLLWIKWSLMYWFPTSFSFSSPYIQAFALKHICKSAIYFFTLSNKSTLNSLALSLFCFENGMLLANFWKDTGTTDMMWLSFTYWSPVRAPHPRFTLSFSDIFMQWCSYSVSLNLASALLLIFCA